MKQRILFLAANPTGTTERQLDEEARAISEEIRRASNRDAFEFVTRLAARPLDLLRALRDVRPAILHFAGHARTEGIYLVDDGGLPAEVTRETLLSTFDAAGQSVRLVVLNGCSTDQLAQALCEIVPVCVGTSAAIRDVAARMFSVGFYGGLASGESPGRAFLQGRAAMQLTSTGDHEQPRLHHRRDVDPNAQISIDPPGPEGGGEFRVDGNEEGSPTEFPRPDLIRTTIEALMRFRCCVVVGPRGIGKTTLASMVARRHTNSQFISAARWADAPLADTAATLTVLDDVGVDDGLFEAGILRQLQGRLLITTRYEEIVQRLLVERACVRHCDEAVVRVHGLAVDDGILFLDQRVGESLTLSEKQQLAKGLNGWPQALQAAAQLVIGGEATCLRSEILEVRAPDVVNPDGTWRVEAMIDRLTRLLVNAQTERSRLLARTLCRTSFAGMDREALAHVAGVSPNKVDAELHALLESGYIRRDRDHRFANDAVLVPHDTLRAYFASQQEESGDRERDSRYVQYLKKILGARDADQVGLSTRMDAWIVACRNTFREDRGNSFSAGLAEYGALIDKLFAARSPSPIHLERVARLLHPRIARAECNEAIPIAQIFARCRPNAVCARTVWEGAYHDDGWARAISIWTAGEHWVQLSNTAPEHADAGRELLWKWVCTALPGSMPNGLDIGDGVGTDIDMAAALGALIALRDLDRVIDLIGRPAFEPWRGRCGAVLRGFRRRLRLVVVYPTIVIAAVDAGRADSARLVLQDAERRLPPGVVEFLRAYVAGERDRAVRVAERLEGVDRPVIAHAVDAARSVALQELLPHSMMAKSMIVIRGPAPPPRRPAEPRANCSNCGTSTPFAQVLVLADKYLCPECSMDLRPGYARQVTAVAIVAFAVAAAFVAHMVLAS